MVDRQELGKKLNLVEDLIPESHSNRPGTKIQPEYITIHNTDNSNPGADARAHAKYLKNADARERKVSWHYTVDDKECIKHLPINEEGWHAATTEGNKKSIGIEICMHEGINQENANHKAATLAAILRYDLKIPRDNIVTHHRWSGKNCPRLLLDNGKPGEKWEQFVEEVNHIYEDIGKQPEAYKLKVVRDTIFKLTARPSPELPDDEKIDVKAGREFQLQSYEDKDTHIKITLLNETLEGRKTWTVYKDHIKVFNPNNVKVIPAGFDPEDKLPAKVNLSIPWFSQRDNNYRPSGTCNVTSVAMCLHYYGIRPDNPNQQLEDELFELVKNKGWDRHVHDHLRRVFLEYGVHDTFKMDATWQEVKTHLANKNPVIYSGKLTSSGHIIVLRGYDETGFWVNDPWGEFFHSGYQAISGENLHYSYNLLEARSMAGSGKTWAHFPEEK
jgi:N-acetylmuramoyl-L-alanine amidase